eukprot:CAMPEP_0194311544 /NCGR_PEP_ID=MMETSP0171-20130528/8465_1 /TAXON_ID=218684 /ORGANISM="Corethron pennatum, Strain L29A3" /LENGTH=253 /DNA_ID=CAMNT_0039065643 /DNA_START=143 /DNA_END=904 /DNA_ORIENTATION=-
MPHLSKVHGFQEYTNPIRSRVEPRKFPNGGGRGRDTTLSMNTIRVIEILVPRLGVLTSTALYFSPAVVVGAAVRASDLGELNVVPLACMSISTVSWLAYGLAVRDPFVILGNIGGSIASIAYVLGVLPLLEGRRLRTIQAVLVGGAAASLSLWTSLVLANVTVGTASSVLGMFAAAIGFALCASPLSTIGEVLKTKNASSILAPLTLAQVMNATLWGLYGFAIKDKFVWGPNIVGFSLGVIPLVLKLLYPSKA